MAPAADPAHRPVDVADPVVAEVADPTGFAGSQARVRVLGLLAAMLLIGGLLAVAFVSPSGDDVSAEELVTAASAVDQEGSVAFESTSSYLFGGGQGAGGAVASGRANDDRSAEVSIRFEGLPLPDYAFVTDGNLVFAEVPKENRFRVDGKRWAAAPLGDEGFTLFGAVGDVTNPVPPLERFLSGAHGKVTTVGPATVRGVDTTQYRVKVDPVPVLEGALAQQRVPGGAPAGLDDLTGELDIEVAPVDVWLDDEGRLRRMEIRIDVRAAGRSGRLQLRHDVFDYGAPVAITLPASNDVFLVDSPATLQALLIP